MSIQSTWVTLDQGANLYGGTKEALRSYVKRWNHRHLDEPEKLIRRRWGRICAEDLLSAIDADAFQATPGARSAEALAELANRGRRHG